MKKLIRKAVPNAVKSLVAPGLQISAKACQSLFDPAFYRLERPDVDAAGGDPLLHFRRYGLAEGSRPNPWFSERYLRSDLHQETLTSGHAVQHYAACDMAQRPRLVFVSHDASRTGAPAIILRLLEMFSESGAFECFSILDAGGERLAEFEALSHTHVMSRARHDHGFTEQAAQAELAALFHPKGVFEGNAPVCALVNSAESARIGRCLSGLGIPTVSLIHEVAAYYKPAVFEEFARLSEQVIFPSQFVKTAAARFSDLDLSKVTVRGQGLLEDGFGSLSRAECRRQLREDLDIEDDAFVVLNVGTKDIRKGVDLFVELAGSFLRGGPRARPVYFVWYGATDQNFLYAQDYVARHELGDSIRLMPSTSQIETVFLGGDVFFLTARADPFPCVIHEAMACGLPVIAFRQGGGAPELIGDDCGCVIDMADLKAGRDAVDRYLSDPALYARHCANAVAKIARDWGYHDYHRDVYQIMQQVVPPPAGGWPALRVADAPNHLAIMRGTVAELDVLDKVAGDVSHVALVDGRFGAEMDVVTDRLRRAGRSYRVYQPDADTKQARAAIVQRLTRKPRPQQLTLINVLQHLTPGLLKQLPYRVAAVEGEGGAPADALYMALPHLDGLALADKAMAALLAEMNPAAGPRISVLE